MFRGAQNDINPYKGHPSPELDDAWAKLVEGELPNFWTRPLFSRFAVSLPC